MLVLVVLGIQSVSACIGLLRLLAREQNMLGNPYASMNTYPNTMPMNNPMNPNQMQNPGMQNPNMQNPFGQQGMNPNQGQGGFGGFGGGGFQG